MAKHQKITRQKLEVYALALGSGSIADQALRHYDEMRTRGRKPEVYMKNAGFVIYSDDNGQTVAKHF